MCKKTNSRKEDLIREFEFEHSRCQSYFDLMYRILEFSFAAIAAIVVLGFGLLENFDKGITNYHVALIFSYVLPICIYVFGTMYLYNIYAMIICGARARKIHKEIYSAGELGELKPIISEYIISNKLVSVLAYGVSLGFYLAVPLASIIISNKFFSVTENIFYYNTLPFILLAIYYAIILVIIVQIIISYFKK